MSHCLLVDPLRYFETIDPIANYISITVLCLLRFSSGQSIVTTIVSRFEVIIVIFLLLKIRLGGSVRKTKSSHYKLPRYVHAHSWLVLTGGRTVI